MSLSGTFTLIMKLIDPFMRKYFKNYFKFLKKKKKGEVRTLGDLRELIQNENDFDKIIRTKSNEEYHYSNIYIQPKFIDNSYIPLEEYTKINEINLTPNANRIPSINLKSEKHNSEFSNHSMVLSPIDISLPPSNFHRMKTVNAIGTGTPLIRKRSQVNSLYILNEGVHTFDLMNSHLEFSDNLSRMIGISIALNEDKSYDKEIFYLSKFASSLPWENKYYREKSKFEEFTQNNLPDWVNIKYNKRFENLRIRIKKYVPLVFHHLRIIDKISIDDCINSLDPILNLEKKDCLKVVGGRSENPILYTWDKKFLIKTISKNEKKVLFDMMKEYQIRMRDTKSLLCRVYGLFRIKVSDHFDSYVLLMKNMCELPLETKYLCFDLKGSTNNRDCILEVDKKIYNDGFKDDVVGRYKNKVLKDKDLIFLGIKFLFSSNDAKNLSNSVENDANFLEKYYITDYSLLLTIHKFRKEDYRQNFKNTRVMKSYDDKYLFNFAIIDFLTVK